LEDGEFFSVDKLGFYAVCVDGRGAGASINLGFDRFDA
jgi:hypothetical protein